MAATVGDPVTTPSHAGVRPACPVPSATPCFDHTALIFTLSFSSVLMDTCTVCQAYGHSHCLFVRFMDTHSGLLSGLGTLAVLFVRLMDTHSACLSSLWARVLFCQAYGHLQSHLSGLWTLTVLVRLMDTHSACQAYGHSQCLSGLWALAVMFVRFMDTHSALLSSLWTLTVFVCQACGHLQC